MLSLRIDQKTKEQSRFFISFLFVSMVSIPLLATSGCGKSNLSQGKAAKMIKEHKKFPIPIEGKLDIGKDIFAYLDTKVLKALSDEGVITYQFLRLYVTANKISAELTDKGKKYITGSGKRPWPHTGQRFVVVKLYEKSFLKVTGIKFLEIGGTKGAVVEYQWKYSNVTPFGLHWKKYDETPRTDKITFALWDDGWRIEGD